MDTFGALFSKIRAFFFIFKKGQGSSLSFFETACVTQVRLGKTLIASNFLYT